MSNSDPENELPRRTVLSSGLAAFGSTLVASALPSEAAKAVTVKSGQFDQDKLKAEFGFKGAVLGAEDPGFSSAASDGLWNKLQPARRPQVIAQVQDEQDVVAAVKFARAHRLKVTVRGGGHSWCSPSLRKSGMLIDLAALNQIVSIDPAAREAVAQPIISNREAQAAFNKFGLAFPSGHCPTVKLSGYLLSGGMSWNQGVWGPGVDSVTAIELVTAQGDRITASATENSDYFWAARGGGAGFFGIALRYHLTLYALPQAITFSVYYYPYEQILDLAHWLDDIVSELPKSVELSLLVVQAPPGLADKAKSSNGKIVSLAATMFADTAEEAAKALQLLDRYPSADHCLSKSTLHPANFEELFDASGALWPDGLRCRVDAMFYDAPLAKIMKAVKDHLVAAPSAKTVFLVAVFTGSHDAPATRADAAFSATGRLYGGPWTMWESAAADADNGAWHEGCVALLKPLVVNHYIGETDFVRHPTFAEDAYSKANWLRLTELRRKLDPNGLFFGFDDGLT